MIIFKLAFLILGIAACFVLFGFLVYFVSRLAGMGWIRSMTEHNRLLESKNTNKETEKEGGNGKT